MGLGILYGYRRHAVSMFIRIPRAGLSQLIRIMRLRVLLTIDDGDPFNVVVSLGEISYFGHWDNIDNPPCMNGREHLQSPSTILIAVARLNRLRIILSISTLFRISGSTQLMSLSKSQSMSIYFDRHPA